MLKQLIPNHCGTETGGRHLVIRWTLLYGSLFMSAFCLPAFADDYSGFWRASVKHRSEVCAGPAPAANGVFSLAISATEPEVRARYHTPSGKPYAPLSFRGGFDEERANLLRLSGSYLFEGGTMNERFTVTFLDQESAEGKSSWDYRKASYRCSGSYKFTLRRQPE